MFTTVLSLLRLRNTNQLDLIQLNLVIFAKRFPSEARNSVSFTVCIQAMQGAFIKCLKLPVTPECHFKKTAYVLSSFTVLSLAFLISVSFCPCFLLSLSPLLLIDNWKRIEDTGSPAVRSFISLFQLSSNESALLACVCVKD